VRRADHYANKRRRDNHDNNEAMPTPISTVGVLNPHQAYTKDLMEHRHFPGMVGGRMLVTRIVKRKMRKALSVGQVNHAMVTWERERRRKSKKS
jgi:hypothetical protein